MASLQWALSWLVVFAVGRANARLLGGRADRASLPEQARGSGDE
jgi:hypothetical protein